MQHLRTIDTPDSSVTPCPTDTYTGLNNPSSPSVVRSAAPHVEPDAPTSGHESPLAAHASAAAARTPSLVRPSIAKRFFATPTAATLARTPRWHARPNLCAHVRSSVYLGPGANKAGETETASRGDRMRGMGGGRERGNLRVEDAVAVHQKDVREEMRFGAPEVSEEAEERLGFSEGEVAGDVRYVQLHPRVRLVHHLERRQGEDNERGARVGLRLLYKRDVDAADERARGGVDEVGVDTLASPVPHQRRPPPAQHAPAQRARAARHGRRGRRSARSALGAQIAEGRKAPPGGGT